MAVAGSIKKAKLEAAMQRRLERGAKKQKAKELRQARRLKAKNV